MAAVTVASQETQGRMQPRATASGVLLAGATHRKFGLITIAANGDTLATGITSIVEVAWVPASVADAVAPIFSSSGLVTFTAGGGETGYLHVWSYN